MQVEFNNTVRLDQGRLDSLKYLAHSARQMGWTALICDDTGSVTLLAGDHKSAAVQILQLRTLELIACRRKLKPALQDSDDPNNLQYSLG